LAPARWPALLGAVALAAVALAAWAVLVKVFSWRIDGQWSFGRLLAPYGYWNATGLIAAIGLAPVLWLATARERGVVIRALAIPALSLLIVVVMLSYSRSALAAAIIGLALPLTLSRTRLRAALALGIAGAGAAAISVWALGDANLSADQTSRAARISSGHSLGLVLLIAFPVLTAAGFAAARATERARLGEATRRRIGAALVVLAALVPVAGAGALALSSRGLTGEISHIWSGLTSSTATVSDNPGRIVNLANTRPRYWRQGLSVGEHHLLAGAGAGSFGVAHVAYPTARLTPQNVGHAHSYVIETFADFGLIGIALNLALLLVWGSASARTLGGLRGRIPSPAGGRAIEAERDGMLALLAAVVVFGISSTLDWTWFFPGVAVPALLCAGWLAGRGPLGSVAAGRPAGGPARRLSARPGASLALTGLVVGAIVISWAIWQPLRADDSVNSGISALARGDTRAALTDGNAAASEDPVSLDPLRELSAVYSALGDRARAEAELVRATQVQPDNAASWSALGQFASARQPRLALAALRRAARLDITSASTQAALEAAARRLGASR
jgi:hypothetical protein